MYYIKLINYLRNQNDIHELKTLTLNSMSNYKESEIDTF